MSEPVPSPGSADFIGDYQVLEALGRGGMGEVLLAWDERLQRRVAIKRIRHDGEITPTLRQRLLREAQTVAGLSHSAIVHVYELLKDDAGDDCIVMEYVEGQTLAAIDPPGHPTAARQPDRAATRKEAHLPSSQRGRGRAGARSHRSRHPFLSGLAHWRDYQRAPDGVSHPFLSASAATWLSFRVSDGGVLHA